MLHIIHYSEFVFTETEIETERQRETETKRKGDSKILKLKDLRRIHKGWMLESTASVCDLDTPVMDCLKHRPGSMLNFVPDTSEPLEGWKLLAAKSRMVMLVLSPSSSTWPEMMATLVTFRLATTLLGKMSSLPGWVPMDHSE